MHPVSIRSDSPARRFSMMVPPACTKANPSPWNVFEDEALTTEEAGPDFLVEGNVELGAHGRAQERFPSGR